MTTLWQRLDEALTDWDQVTRRLHRSRRAISEEYRSADPGLSGGPRRQLTDYHSGFFSWEVRRCSRIATLFAATDSRNSHGVPVSRILFCSIWGRLESAKDRWAAQDHHPCRRTERHSLPIPSSVSFSFRVCVWLLAKRHDRYPSSDDYSCCRLMGVFTPDRDRGYKNDSIVRSKLSMITGFVI